MAGKSLLHQFGWRTGKYEIAKEAILSGKKREPMEGSFRKQGSSDHEPPPKKRRTDDDDDPWGDDSMEFTQADLHDIEDIELQASQAVTHRPEGVVPGPAVPTQGQVSGASETFVKPQLSRSSSSSISSGSRGGTRLISNGSSHSAQNSMNQSHSSSGSHSSSYMSHSSYPSSLSNYSSTSSSSTSVKTGSSTENIPSQSGSMSRPSTGSLDLSTSISVESQSSTTEIVKMKQECAALKLQLENIKQEVCIKEGENRLLRDNLNKKDVELDTLKMEKINKIYQQNIQQSDKEKQLQNDLARLQTQLQFKDQEERELSSRIRDLESQLRNQQSGGPSASQSYPQQSGSVSPKPRKVQAEERSPKGSSGFPSKRTFMAAEGSPQKVKVKVMQAGDNMREVGPDSSQKVCQTLARGRRISRLKLPDTGCPRTGSRIVGRLLDLPPSVSGTISERGILGLLNTPCTSTSLYNVQFDRDKDTSMLSPVKSRRISDLHSLVIQLDKPELVSLVPVDHFNMAVQGLSNLLKADNQSISSSDCNLSVASTSDNLANTSERLPILEDAILVLPLISDYLKHYTDMLEATFETSASSTTSSSSPESFDTSSESPTGSLGLFLKTTANFANDLESLAVASLNTLLELVSCEGVSRLLLDLENCQMSQITQAGVQPMDIESSGSETDLPMKDASSRFTHIPRKYIVKLNILQKVLKLSNPGTKERLYNARIVTTCLNILTLLANSADKQHITCLMPVLSEESLQNCLDHEADVTIVTRGLQLFRSLVRSNQVVSSLCSNTTGCVLMTVYSASLTERWQAAPVSSQLHIASLIVDSILYLASSHKGCFTLILESDCRCSSEAVKGIVTILHSVMKICQKYESNKQSVLKPDEQTDQSQEAISEDSLRKQEEGYIETSQRILQTGLQLLHLIYQFDSGFMNRHTPVQHKYVQLICGLTHMFRPIENNDSEMNALQDLWDFNQDDSELSQDSESDDQEVMDT